MEIKHESTNHAYKVVQSEQESNTIMYDVSLIIYLWTKYMEWQREYIVWEQKCMHTFFYEDDIVQQITE